MQTHEWEALLDGTTPGPWVVRTNAEGDTWLEGPAPDNGDLPPQPFEVCFYHNLKDVKAAAAAPTSVAEVVRLRRALEEQLKELSDELEAEGIETYDDIDDTWPSMQRYGELSEVIAQRNFLTRILEGDTNA